MADDFLPVRLAVRYPFPDEQSGGLSAYDVTKSLHGFCKAINISSHYLVNGNVIFQAPAVRGASLYIKPSREGSYEQLLDLWIQYKDVIVLGVSTSITAAVVYDFIKLTFRRSLGQKHQPETQEVSKLVSDAQGDLNALSEAMDGPLIEAHRTIEKKQAPLIDIEAGGETVAVLDAQSLDYVKTRIVSDRIEEIEVSVSSYNINSRKGRFYAPTLEQTIPFDPQKGSKFSFPSAISWSLDRSNRGYYSIIIVRVKRVLSILNETKRLILIDVPQQELPR